MKWMKKISRSLLLSSPPDTQPARNATQRVAGGDKLAKSLRAGHFSPLTSERGYAMVAIILVILVVFSIALVSGSTTFESTPDSIVIRKTSPTPPASGTTSPTPPPANTAGWKITVKNINCEGSRAKGYIDLNGVENGYSAIEIRKSDGSYEIIDSEEFKSPLTLVELTLEGSRGFSNSGWRFKLFSGGTKTDTTWTGGVERAVYNGSPTGCT